MNNNNFCQSTINITEFFTEWIDVFIQTFLSSSYITIVTNRGSDSHCLRATKASDVRESVSLKVPLVFFKWRKLFRREMSTGQDRREDIEKHGGSVTPHRLIIGPLCGLMWTYDVICVNKADPACSLCSFCVLAKRSLFYHNAMNEAEGSYRNCQ